ncbi:uncharacterized protein LOC113018267 [Tachysurus ichikawai]
MLKPYHDREKTPSDAADQTVGPVVSSVAVSVEVASPPNISDCRQRPEEPLPTFVAHMLGEFRKLKTPPPQQEQIDVIWKHALEKYRLVLYGTPMPSAMDLLLRAHELHAVHTPRSRTTTVRDQVLSHVEDMASTSHWNTPFRGKVNLYGHAFDATLDTSASLSAVCLAVVSNLPGGMTHMKSWSSPPVQLADGAPCCPLGLIWLSLGFMGQRFYQRFAVFENLFSPGVLGMDFLMRSSVTLHVPSRTVVLGEVLPPSEEVEVNEAAIDMDQKCMLTELLESFGVLFDDHLGHTSLVEHEIDTGNAKPVHLAPYRTSPAKNELIESQIKDMLRDGIIEPAAGPWAAKVVIVPKSSGEPRFYYSYLPELFHVRDAAFASPRMAKRNVQSAVVSDLPGGLTRMKSWSSPPVQLADGAPCCPLGLIWLSLGFMGQRFYQRFAVFENLFSPGVLGMDFLMRSSVTLHVPSRTVVLGEVLPPSEEVEVNEAAIDMDQKCMLTELLESFGVLFDDHLGHTSLVEHEIDTGNAKPVHLAPYRTSPAKNELIESQIKDMLRDGIIEPAAGSQSSAETDESSEDVLIPLEQLITFFHRKKTEISSRMDDPQLFFEHLEDHGLISEDLYQKVIKMKSMDRRQKAVYTVLKSLEKEPNKIKEFWSCVFKEHIMQKYPFLRSLQSSLNKSFLLSQNLPWVEKPTRN